MSSHKDEETKGIRAMLVLDIIGKPAEHLVKTLENLIGQIDAEKGVSVKSKTIKEPVLLKDNKEIYTTFAEVEVEVEEISYLAILMFKFMPAHIEILEPELIALTNSGWSDILSELIRRLHGYDEVARVLQFQNAQLKKKLEELEPSQKTQPNKNNSKEKTKSLNPKK